MSHNKLNLEEILKRFKLAHGDTYDYSLITENNYRSNGSKVEIICSQHGPFKQCFGKHSNGTGCPKCGRARANKKLTISYKDIIVRFNEIHDNKYDYSLVKDNYKNTKNKVKIICPEHGVFEQMPYSHLAGTRCNKCYKDISKIELKIHNFLDSMNIHYIKNDRSILDSKELDIYIPDFKLAIECNGLYWHSDKFKTPNYHLSKTLECETKNITLLQFWEHEINNKFDIVKSMISSRLNSNTNVIYARKCKIVNITDNKLVQSFEELNHLQGHANSSLKLGCYYNDELVALMTFGKPRFNKECQWELIRYCNKLNTIVVGAPSKILKHFINNYLERDEKIITYANKRYSNGNLYKVLNFQYINISSPSYFYVSKTGEIVPRYKAQKHKLSMLLNNFDKNKTESENMKLHGYNKIYDCGNLVYRFKRSYMKELVIYGKTDCPQCDSLLNRLKNVPFKYLTLGIDFTREELMDIKPANVRTFPVSFIKENDTLTYIKNEDIDIYIS